MSTIEVTAAIIGHNQRVLITQRGEGKHLEGFWEFPGGKLEANETLQDCLTREIREELNIIVKVNSHIVTVKHVYAQKIINLHAFHCEYDGGELTLKDHSDAKWVSMDELVNFKFAPADLPIIKHLMDHV